MSFSHRAVPHLKIIQNQLLWRTLAAPCAEVEAANYGTDRHPVIHIPARVNTSPRSLQQAALYRSWHSCSHAWWCKCRGACTHTHTCTHILVFYFASTLKPCLYPQHLWSCGDQLKWTHVVRRVGTQHVIPGHTHTHTHSTRYYVFYLQPCGVFGTERAAHCSGHTLGNSPQEDSLRERSRGEKQPRGCSRW